MEQPEYNLFHRKRVEASLKCNERIQESSISYMY